jgi:hypothetical protein
MVTDFLRLCIDILSLTLYQGSGLVDNGTSSQCDPVTMIKRFPASRRHCLPAHLPPILARRQRWLASHAVRPAGEGVNNDLGTWVEDEGGRYTSLETDRSFGGSHHYSAENLGINVMVCGRNLAKVMNVFCY